MAILKPVAVLSKLLKRLHALPPKRRKKPRLSEKVSNEWKTSESAKRLKWINLDSVKNLLKRKRINALNKNVLGELKLTKKLWKSARTKMRKIAKVREKPTRKSKRK